MNRLQPKIDITLLWQTKSLTGPLGQLINDIIKHELHTKHIHTKLKVWSKTKNTNHDFVNVIQCMQHDDGGPHFITVPTVHTIYYAYGWYFLVVEYEPFYQ